MSERTHIEVGKVNVRRTSEMVFPHLNPSKPISISAISATQMFVLYDNGNVKRVFFPEGLEITCP